MLKKVLVAIAVLVLLLVVVPLVTALFFKTSFTIEREIVIDKPLAEVFDYIKHLKNQEKYTIWAKLDPQTKRTYRGEDGTVGFVAAWASDNPNVGKGEQEITKIVKGQRVDVEIRMKSPFESTDPAYTLTEAVGENQTRVKSGYHGKMSYPLNLMCFYMEQIITDILDTNLRNLKATLEGKSTTADAAAIQATSPTP